MSLELALSRELTQPKGEPQKIFGLNPSDYDSLLERIKSFQFPTIQNLPTAPAWVQQYITENNLRPPESQSRPYTPSPYADPVLQRLYQGYFLGRH